MVNKKLNVTYQSNLTKYTQLLVKLPTLPTKVKVCYFLSKFCPKKSTKKQERKLQPSKIFYPYSSEVLAASDTKATEKKLFKFLKPQAF